MSARDDLHRSMAEYLAAKYPGTRWHWRSEAQVVSEPDRDEIERQIAEHRRVLRDVHGFDLDRPCDRPTGIDWAAFWAADPPAPCPHPEQASSEDDLAMMNAYSKLRRLERFRDALEAERRVAVTTCPLPGPRTATRPRERHEQRRQRRSSSSSSSDDGPGEPEPPAAGRLANCALADVGTPTLLVGAER